MTSRRKELTEQIVIRLEPQMLEQIRRDADANERTVSQSIRYLLRGALRQHTDGLQHA